LTFSKDLYKIYVEGGRKGVSDMMLNFPDYQMAVKLKMEKLLKEAEEYRMLKKLLKKKKEQENAPLMEKERWKRKGLLHA